MVERVVFEINTSAVHLFMFSQGEATIHYNKLQADPKQGKSLDIGTSSIGHLHTFSLDALFVYRTVYG